jgi:hypothetical protein
MNGLYFDGELIANFRTLLNSNTVKGIEFTVADPGNRTDNIIYLISINAEGKLYIRYNDTLYEIGDIVQN